MKIIYLFRDPRGIISSELEYNLKFRKGKKDLIFSLYNLAKQWRKHVYFSYKFQNSSSMKNNIFFLKYEELVADPTNQINKLFYFLKLKKDKFKLRLNFNNSFHNNKIRKRITTKNVDMWKKKLSTNQIKFIENILFFEMNYLEYKTINEFKKKPSFFKKDLIANVISEFDYRNELNRYEYIVKKKNYNNKKLEKLFLDADFARFLNKSYLSQLD